MDWKERENLVKPFLPSSTDTTNSKAKRRLPSLRAFIRTQVYILVFTVIHTIFSLYIRLRRALHSIRNHVLGILYYPHRTPDLILKDVNNLSKIPRHLSVILDFDDSRSGGDNLEGLLNDISEIAAWCAGAGVPLLSVYEKTGVLKSLIPRTHKAISRTFLSYFGPHDKPTLSLRIPRQTSFSPPTTPPSPTSTNTRTPVTASTVGETVETKPTTTHSHPLHFKPYAHLTVLLLSADDGRSTLVDLTKTLTYMAQRGKLAPADIRGDLIDAEICESVMSEPDLLIIFGPQVILNGFPPWQVRLTEIFHSPDNEGVKYQIFLQALHRFAKAQMRFGR